MLEQGRGTETADQSPMSDPEIPHIQDVVPPLFRVRAERELEMETDGRIDGDETQMAGPWGPFSTLTVTVLS